MKMTRSKKQCLVTHRKVEQSRVAENHLCAQSVGAVIAILASLIPSLRLSPDPHDNWFTAITSDLLLLLLLPLILMLYDEHDEAGEEQLRLNLVASIQLQFTSPSLVFSEKFNEATKILPKGL